MQTITPGKLVEALKWRYATKAFDASRKLPADVWQALEQALVLSASSYGLQPYRFLVVNDAARRAELVAYSWGQRQVVDASHFVVLASRTGMTAEDVDRLIERTHRVRGVPADALKAYREMMMGDLVNGPRQGMAHEWAARQAYIALGNLLTSAALLGVDTCPMEGMVPAEYDRILGLKGSGYATVVACALGYRAQTDKYARLPKVRFETPELIQTV